MGDCGPTHQVGTFSGCVDDLHTGGILQDIYMRDCLVTWSASLYRIRPGSQVYDSLLEKFLESHGNTANDEHFFSSIDKQSVGKNYTGFRRHATSMRPGSKG